MSASTNDKATANSQGTSGQFHSSVPPSEPLTTSGHQTGRIVSEKDGADEFRAQVLPAGSAPADRTFEPKTSKSGIATSASDTIGGSTSGDVHTGLGHPGSGQSSKEVRHDGKSHSKSERSGLEGLGGAGSMMID